MQMKKTLKKATLFFLILILVIAAWQMGFFSYLNFTYVKDHLEELTQSYHVRPFRFLLMYLALYIFVTALSIPGGATMLTLLGGAIMGFWPSLLAVTFASSAGATLAFWASRFLLKDFFERKFKLQARTAREEVQRNGVYYLLTLRLMPIFPFFLINILMGLTTMRSLVFFLVSFVGMIPGIAVYVFAGKSFATLESSKEIFSFKVFLLLTLLGLFPLISKWIIEKWKVTKLYRPYPKPSRFDYNTIVIGGGAAGLVSSLITSALKAKVALIEKEKMGGDCLYTGCVPSKSLIHSARLARMRGTVLDFDQVIKQIKKVQAEIEPHDSKERYTAMGVDCVSGIAEILSPYEVRVNGKVLTARNLIIATGARPRLPEIPGLSKMPYVTSETLWQLKEKPKKLLVLGAGPIGCEMAQAFHRLGALVLLLEEGKEILPKEDSDISSVIEKQFRDEGIELYLYTEAKEFFCTEGKYFVKVESLGKEMLLEFDLLLLATGRTANVQGFGLEKLKVDLNKNGTIKTNPLMQTNFPNIYACGDVAGPYQFTHMASYQAWFAAVNSLFSRLKKFTVNYGQVSWCTFTDPEVATAGLNEKMCKDKELEYEVTVFPFSELDRAIIDGETTGLVKVLTKKGSHKILGASIAGPEAGLLIMEFVSAIQYNKGMKDLLKTIHPYPTLSEANKYAAGVWQKNHSPQLALFILEKVFRWLRG